MKYSLLALCVFISLALARFPESFGKYPPLLSCIETIRLNDSTGEVVRIDTTFLTHTEELGIHTVESKSISHFSDYSQYTSDGIWLEDHESSRFPRSSNSRTVSYDLGTRMEKVTYGSYSGAGKSTHRDSGVTRTHYNEYGFPDMAEGWLKSGSFGSQKHYNISTVYYYKKEAVDRLDSIVNKRSSLANPDDPATITTTRYTYVDNNDFTQMTIYKEYTKGDSSWLADITPIVKICREDDTTIFNYSSKDGELRSKKQTHYDENRRVTCEKSFDVATDSLLEMIETTYREEGWPLTVKNTNRDSLGVILLREIKNYAYEFVPTAVMHTGGLQNGIVPSLSITSKTLHVTGLLGYRLQQAKLVIFDVKGRVLLEKSVSKRQNCVDLGALSSGAYIALLKLDGIRTDPTRFTIK